MTRAGHRREPPSRSAGGDQALRRSRRVAVGQLRARARASWSGSSVPTAPGRRRCCRSWPACSSPDEGELTLARAATPGWVPQRPALYSKLSVAENLRLFARLEKVTDPEAAVTRMLAQTGPRRARRRGGRQALGRQPATGQHRHRAALGAGAAAARRAVGVAGPTPARAPVGVHLGAAARPRWSSPPTTWREVERYATRVLLLADGELLFTGTPRELEAGRRGRSARPRGGAGRASCTAGPLSTADALAADQGPPDPAALAAAGRAARRLSDRHRPDDRLRPVQSAEQADRGLLQRGAQGQRARSAWATRSSTWPATPRTCSGSVQPIKVHSRARGDRRRARRPGAGGGGHPGGPAPADPEPHHPGRREPDGCSSISTARTRSSASSSTRRSPSRINQVEQDVSKQVLRVAINDLQQVLNGGSVQILGQTVRLLGLRDARTIVQGTLALAARATRRCARR